MKLVHNHYCHLLVPSCNFSIKKKSFPCNHFSSLFYRSIEYYGKMSRNASYRARTFLCEFGMDSGLLGGISSSILSAFFTDKFALSQSDARISVAYKISQWNHWLNAWWNAPQDLTPLPPPPKKNIYKRNYKKNKSKTDLIHKIIISVNFICVKNYAFNVLFLT